MRLKFLASAASAAFIAAGVAAYAQETQKHDAPAAAHEQGSPRAGEMKGGAEGANPARAEGERAGQPRAAEAPGQPHKEMQGQNERQGAESQKRTAEPRNEKTPAERTGAKEPEQNAPQTGAKERDHNAPQTGEKERDRNAPQTGAKERDHNAPQTGAKERDHNAPQTGEKERDRNAPQTGAKDRDHNAPQTGAAERDRNAPRTAERNENHGPARVRGNVKMSPEHATRVSEVLRREGHRENVNISVRVGVRVPETVSLRPLPEDIIAFVPEYRGYDYFIDENDEIVFVAPQTHEVVGMIDYEGRAAAVDSPRAARPCPTED